MTATAPPPPAAPAPAHAAIAIRGLVKRYGSLHAVDDLSLTVPRGGVFGLIGPNGAGKTTTMLAVVTLLIPDQGTIEVAGHDPVTEPAAVRARVGFMPDFFGVYDGLSCAEYLDFFASAYGIPAGERGAQVAALLELVELSHKADTDVAGLSRGMQQRLALARALVHEPEVLVLDEPASGLDPRARVELREIVVELGRAGHTVLISSHILAELEELCDRVAIMEAGRVLAAGTPDEIRTSVRAALTVSARILGGEAAMQQAQHVIAGHGALRVVVEGDVLRFELPGGDELAADVLAALVTAGVRIADYREDRGGLERLFLSVTEGIVR